MTVERAALSEAPAVRADSLQAWSVAVRPRTLPVAVSPVLVGATLGFERTGSIDWVVALLALAAALLMQIISNMQNDVGYTVRGGESSGTRTGLPRATANGWLSVGRVRLGIVVLALLAFGLGLALVATAGGRCWPSARLHCWRRWPTWAGPSPSPTRRLANSRSSSSSAWWRSSDPTGC
jgi:1,4-dihydroxy-2-naphthoate octaprenyltransferase